MGLLKQTGFRQALDEQGAGISKAQKYVYQSGTQNLCALFRDADLTVSQANPIIADNEGHFRLCHVMDGYYRVEIKTSAEALPLNVEEVVVSGDSVIAVKAQFATLAELAEDTILSYAFDGYGVTAAPGDLVQVLVNDSQYEIAGAGAPDAHITTRNGVALFEAGTRFSTLARFQEAVARGTAYQTGDTILAGGAQYVFADDGNTDLPGLPGWTQIVQQGGTQSIDPDELAAVANAVNEAEAARDAAQFAALTAGAPLHESVAAGLAVTTDGDVFFVADSAGTVLYRNDAGAATLLNRLSEALFDSVADVLGIAHPLPSGLMLRTRLEGYGYEVAASSAGDHHLMTAGGVKLYALPSPGGFHIEQFGGKADNGTTDNSVPMQAMVDKLAINGLNAVLSAQGGIGTGNQPNNATTAYAFKTKITLPVASKFYLRGENGAVINWEPPADHDPLFEIQAGNNDTAKFKFEGILAQLSKNGNRGKFLATVSTGVGRFQGFVMRDCHFQAKNYVIDMITDYTYKPIFQNIFITGGGIRWRGDVGVNFTTSSATINDVQIAIGAGGSNTSHGPMLWLEGWGGFSGHGNILEGNARMDADGFDLANGESVSTLYLKNCSGFRAIEFFAHSELTGLYDPPIAGVHDGGTDYDIFIDNPAGSNRQDFNITLGGGLEMVPNDRIKLTNAANNAFAILKMQGGHVDPGTADMTGPVSLVRSNPQYAPNNADGNALWADPRQRVEGRVNTKGYNADGPMLMLPTPSLQLYDYTGGLPSNPQFPLQIYANGGQDPQRYVQNDPTFGPTLIFRSGNGHQFELGLSIPGLPQGGALVTAFWTARLVRTTGLTGSFVGDFRTSGGYVSNMYGLLPHVPEMVPLQWNNIETQLQVPGSVADNGGLFRFPSLRNLTAWLQVSAMSVSLGGGEHVGRGCVSGKNFTCLEDPYYNVGNGNTPADGTVIVGDTVISQGFTSDYIEKWVCTAQGTSRPISTTADTTSGSNAITLADSTELVPGDFITIAGLNGTKRVLSVNYAANTAVISSNANATTTAAAVANDDPTWEPRWNGKVLTGNGSPVGVLTPDVVGMQYQDAAAPAIWQATGLTSADWIALG